MQFVKNGPDIPEHLLQAHEDGRVVFFCGAGISYPAGLPDFKGLVKKLFCALGETPNIMQKAAIRKGQFDTAIGLLEADFVGGRAAVRRVLPSILKSRNVPPDAIATHKALLTLARTREDHTRLITTNFDRLFEIAKSRDKLRIESMQAPRLPVPKDRWDGLVYLHGLLPAKQKLENGKLDHLVFSSGDFGLAYLVDRWAARFVGELFRNFTVCFVGYSINDAILRYMMDALAADHQLGESAPQTFAFGSYRRSREEQCFNEWKAKGVTPILYRERTRKHIRHGYLHDTLSAWAGSYRDGIGGKEQVIIRNVQTLPLPGIKKDDFVGRVLWAISDPSGIPAMRFAYMDPAPPLAWLKVFCEERYGQEDLMQFGVPPKAANDNELSFSLVRRPSPYNLAPKMALVDYNAPRVKWDKVMCQLARWLVRHLDDPELPLWVAKQGGQMHDGLVRLIEESLRKSAQSATPRLHMRTLWRLLLTGRVWPPVRIIDLYGWRNRVKRDGLTATLRLELREALTPRVLLRRPIRWSREPQSTGEPESLSDLVQWEIKLSTDSVPFSLHDLVDVPHWEDALPSLLADFSLLLRDSLDLMRELGGASDMRDPSYIYRPSISEHSQNRSLRAWVQLIVLTRDAWLAIAKKSPEQARRVAEDWWRTPYPLFQRLALFAAAQDEVIPHRQALDWLLAEDRRWLWSPVTRRETMRLLVAIADKLNPNELKELELAILAEPPRTMLERSIESDRWSKIVERDTWLLLKKLTWAKAKLGPRGSERLIELSAKYPDWELIENERDEFPFWVSFGTERPEPISTPRQRRKLIEWIRQNPGVKRLSDDDWLQRCRDSFCTTAYVLYALAREEVWPVDRWRVALQAWSEGELIKSSWYYLGPVLANAPDEKLEDIAWGISVWLNLVAERFDHHEGLFLEICCRILNFEYQDDVDIDDPVEQAINHPIGHVTEALLYWWFRSSPEDGKLLENRIKKYFTQICNTQIDKFRHGRVLLSRYVILLFRVDVEWATKNLLPLFDWRCSEVEARAAWEGFLWSPRIDRSFIEVAWRPFLDTARHYVELGEYAERYATLLTTVALDLGDTIPKHGIITATRDLPEAGLLSALLTVIHALDGAGNQRQQYWKNRALPYFNSIWPKSRDLITPAISEQIAKICIFSREEFAGAFEKLRDFLQPLGNSRVLICMLHETKICQEFPGPAFYFLRTVIGGTGGARVGFDLPVRELKECLERIKESEPELGRDGYFVSIWNYIEFISPKES